MNLQERLAEFFTRANIAAYLTGGAARDTIMNRATHDLDVTVVGNAAPLARAFADELNGAFYVLDAEFDVARIILTLPDGARTNVDVARQRGDHIEDDLASRDFSINAMAVPLANGQWMISSNAVVDPFGGLYDLMAQRVKTIGATVFQNDPVRLLRAARLAITLGFTIEEQTFAQIQRDAELLERGAAERLRDELLKILAADNVRANLELLDDLGLLARLMPELDATRGVTQSPPHTLDVFEHSRQVVNALEEIQRTEYSSLADGRFAKRLQEHMARDVSSGHSRALLLRLTALLHDVGKPATRTVEPEGRIRFFGHEEKGAELVAQFLTRLRFSNEEISLARLIIAEHLRPLALSQQATISNRAIYRFFRDTREAGIDICLHAWADQRGKPGKDDNEDAALAHALAQLLSAYFEHPTQVVAPPALLNGHDVMGILNIEGGPRVREILEAVREAQASGEVTDRAQAIEFVKKI